MPLPPRRQSAASLTLDALTPVEVLCLLAGWHPVKPWENPALAPTHRWPDWSSFLRDYALVREELLAREAPRHPVGWEPFAAKAARYRDAHGLDALDKANSYQVRGELSPREGESYTDYQRRVAAAEAGDDGD